MRCTAVMVIPWFVESTPPFRSTFIAMDIITAFITSAHPCSSHGYGHGSICATACRKLALGASVRQNVGDMWRHFSVCAPRRPRWVERAAVPEGVVVGGVIRRSKAAIAIITSITSLFSIKW